LGGSSHKQFIATALWRIATPDDAGAIHTIRKAVIRSPLNAALSMNGSFREGCLLDFAESECPERAVPDRLRRKGSDKIVSGSILNS